VDLDYETTLFRNHEFVSPRSDWPRAWQNWIRRAAHNGKGEHPKRNGEMLTLDPTVPQATIDQLAADFVARAKAEMAADATQRFHA
jgi:hypothetical protein